MLSRSTDSPNRLAFRILLLLNSSHLAPFNTQDLTQVLQDLVHTPAQVRSILCADIRISHVFQQALTYSILSH